MTKPSNGYGPRYPYLDGRGLFVTANGDIVEAPRGDEDLMRHDPPRTRQSHPYNYDPITIWGEPRPNAACNGTLYTDRLQQGDGAKYERLARKHYRSGESGYARPFDAYNCQGHLIQAFLRDWCEDPALKLLRVIEYCSPTTGFQTWRLDYTSPKDAP